MVQHPGCGRTGGRHPTEHNMLALVCHNYYDTGFWEFRRIHQPTLECVTPTHPNYRWCCVRFPQLLQVKLILSVSYILRCNQIIWICTWSVSDTTMVANLVSIWTLKSTSVRILSHSWISFHVRFNAHVFVCFCYAVLKASLYALQVCHGIQYENATEENPG